MQSKYASANRIPSRRASYRGTGVACAAFMDCRWYFRAPSTPTSCAYLTASATYSDQAAYLADSVISVALPRIQERSWSENSSIVAGGFFAFDGLTGAIEAGRLSNTPRARGGD